MRLGASPREQWTAECEWRLTHVLPSSLVSSPSLLPHSKAWERGLLPSYMYSHIKLHYLFLPASGVDDILPILSYAIIRSGLPQLVSETALMEDFIQDG